jgi:hypothetical protein
MRIVARKIYRAFHELDRFSDERCQLFLRRAYGGIGFQLGVGLACVFVFVLTIVIVGMIVIPLVGSLARAIRNDGMEVLATLAGLSSMIMLAAIASLLVRDAVLRLRLRHHVGKARCLRCDYSLLGQRVVQGVVTCSECGHAVTVAELGLESPDDLLPAAES